MAVPALCEKCGRWFTNPLFVVEGSGATITSEGARINHLGCGGYGVIPEGEYKFTEDGVHAVLAAGLSADDIRQLVALLERTRGAATYEELVAVVEEAPPAVAAAIRDQLPADPAAARLNLSMLAAALAAVAVAGYGIKAAHDDAEVAHKDAQAQTQVTQRLDRDMTERVPQIVRDAVQEALHPGAAAPKPGRNAPCWCGSGQKYKKCHGQ